jgi:hypothetical protein
MLIVSEVCGNCTRVLPLTIVVVINSNITVCVETRFSVFVVGSRFDSAAGFSTSGAKLVDSVPILLVARSTIEIGQRLVTPSEAAGRAVVNPKIKNKSVTAKPPSQSPRSRRGVELGDPRAAPAPPGRRPTSGASRFPFQGR